MKKTHPNTRLSTIVCVLCMLLIASAFASQSHEAFRSSEVRFADSSVGGLAIVPASCPSNPHTAGECSLPECSLSVSPTTVNQPSASTLSWSSSYASTFSISSVGSVGASGSTSVAPSSDTTYTGTVSNANDSNSCSTTLVVNSQCTAPWGSTVTHGNSVTAYQASTVPYGSSCASETRTCNDGTLSGTYTYSSCSVNSPANCTLDGATVAHGESRAFYSTQTAPSGQLCSSYAESRTCTNGTLSGSATYEFASCGCTSSYSCSDQVIQHTNNQCEVSNVNNPPGCVSPAFCSVGSSTCLYPPPSFSSDGHLTINPQIIFSGNTTQVFWEVNNVSSCSVTATPSNGVYWSGASAGCDGTSCYAGASGKTTGVINAPTTFALSCSGLDGSSVYEEESIILNPVFQEI